MVVYRVSSKVSIDEVIDYLKKNVKGYSVVQLFDPNVVVSINHLRFAYGTAKLNYINDKMRSKTLSNELMLCVSANQHFVKAVKFAGAKTNKDFFIVFENMSGGTVNIILKDLQIKQKKLEFTPDFKLWGVTSNQLKVYTLEQLIIEKMALSRL